MFCYPKFLLLHSQVCEMEPALYKFIIIISYKNRYCCYVPICVNKYNI